MFTGAFAVPGQAGAAGYDQTCGILPGDGYFSYVRVANMSCRHGKKVAFKARKKFCNARRDCFMRTDTKIYRGEVRRNGWKCKVTVGWEYLRVKCRRGNERTIYRGGA
jgi:hypothetical protein